MIPILYEANETSFTSEGVARLTDATSGKVVEGRNGKFELTMVYPADSDAFQLIDNNMLILAKPNDTKALQPFRIKKITTPLNGKVTIYAQHIGYDLAGDPVRPFSATGIVATLNGIKNNSLIANNFTFTTDIVNTTTRFELKVPASARACLGGMDGSVLDLFGGSDSGEFEWDRFAVKFLAHRGSDNGVTIRYGKNMTDLNKESSAESLYTGVLAYWTNTESGDTVQSAIQYVTNHANYPVERIYILDASQDFQSKPTVAQLNTRAQQYRDANNVGVPKVNIKVSFVPLWQSEEYKNLAPLERVSLCDTVTVYYDKYGVNATAKVIETDYDFLKERYNSITLGDAKSDLGDTIRQEIDTTVNKKSEEATSFLEQAIAEATQLITGGDGGYVVISQDADKHPYEILIMDNPDKTQAVNVIRMNQNGIGFSTNGYNGPFTTAWTIDGGFVADFIKSGTIDSININGSVISFGSGSETTVMQTDTVTNYIDYPGQPIQETYQTSTIRGTGLEVSGSKLISLRGNTDWSGTNYKSRLNLSPYRLYLETSNTPSGGNEALTTVVDVDGVSGGGGIIVSAKTGFVYGKFHRAVNNYNTYPNVLHPFFSSFTYAIRSNLMGGGRCAFYTIGDLCFLQLSDLTFLNVAHNNTNTDICFNGIPKAKHDVTFVVNTYGASTNVYYGHRLIVHNEGVYFHYDGASSYTSWQFYGSVAYVIADDAGTDSEGVW